MTTNDLLAHIRRGFPLVTNAKIELGMMFNYGYSSALISEATRESRITLQDWKDLNNELDACVKQWHIDHPKA